MELRRRIPLLMLALLVPASAPAETPASEDRAAAERLRTIQDDVMRFPAPEHEGALTALLAEVRRLESEDLPGRLRRRLADPNPALGRQLATEYFRSWFLLEGWRRADPPTPALRAIADLVHLHGEHGDLIAVLRNYTFDGWYQSYLLLRARALTERVRESPPRLAESLINTIIAVTGRGDRHAFRLERALLAGLSHGDEGVRLGVVRWLLPGGVVRSLEVRALLESSDALRARIEVMRTSDPSSAVQTYFTSYPPTVPPATPIAETAMSLLMPDPEGGEWIVEPRQRFRAVTELFARPEPIRSEAARDRLLALLHEDPNEAVRWSVVQSLFEHRAEDPRFLPALVRALHHDPSSALRRAIAGTLEPVGEGDRSVAVALSRAYVQRRIPERNEWNCVDVFRF